MFPIEREPCGALPGKEGGKLHVDIQPEPSVKSRHWNYWILKHICEILNILFHLYIYIYICVCVSMKKCLRWFLREVLVIIYEDFLKKKKLPPTVLWFKVFIKLDEVFVSTPVTHRRYAWCWPHPSLRLMETSIHSFNWMLAEKVVWN
jgi:hypothetical protein